MPGWGWGWGWGWGLGHGWGSGWGQGSGSGSGSGSGWGWGSGGAQRAVAGVDDTAVGGGRSDRVEGAEAVATPLSHRPVVPDGAHLLVEGELVVDLRVALDCVHPLAPLGRHVDGARRRAEEHHARVEPRGAARALLVAAVLLDLVGGAHTAVGIEGHVQAVSATHDVRLGQRVEEGIRRLDPRRVHVRDADVPVGAEQPEDGLRLGDAVVAEGARLPTEAVGAAARRVVLGLGLGAHLVASGK